MGKYDQLKEQEKSAVDWWAQIQLEKQASIPDWRGIFARGNPETFLATAKESIASGEGVPQIVEAFKRRPTVAQPQGLNR